MTIKLIVMEPDSIVLIPAKESADLVKEELARAVGHCTYEPTKVKILDKEVSGYRIKMPTGIMPSYHKIEVYKQRNVIISYLWSQDNEIKSFCQLTAYDNRGTVGSAGEGSGEDK